MKATYNGYRKSMAKRMKMLRQETTSYRLFVATFFGQVLGLTRRQIRTLKNAKKALSK